MKYFSLLFCFLFLVTSSTLAQDETSITKKKLYNPAEDATTEIGNAVDKAKKEGKHVLLQIGGNWCGWCILFDEKVQSNDTLLTAIQKDYVVYHLNHSLENKNEDVLKTLGYPQRFGFPVFVVLDGDGNRLHTQYSGYLEEGKGHSTKKTLTFLRNWTPSAIDPKNYVKRTRK